jgi:hypothetical protein
MRVSIHYIPVQFGGGLSADHGILFLVRLYMIITIAITRIAKARG